ncbi:hypothetical protein AZA_90324 [Nitrospirillum viridazoti Y2]|nr:hypothetical protein AZA_90324 [Nitrospirillum amazonense Y2]
MLPGLQHPLCRGATPLPGIGIALRPPAVPPDERAGRGRHRRVAAGRSPAAAARIAHRALLRRQRHHPVQPPAHAVLPRRRLSARPAPAGGGGLFRQHAGGGLPHLSWPGPGA